MPRPRNGDARTTQLLEAAAGLFNSKGYHATTVDDIGAAVGLTGPAIYRYYRSGKAELLTNLFDNTMDFLEMKARTVESEAMSGSDALAELLAAHVDFVLGNRTRMRIIRAEVNSLPAEARHRFRIAQQAYLQSWASTLRRARQDLNNNEALVIVAGVVALVNQYARRKNELEDSILRSWITSLALAALHAPVPT